jgi:colanic acid/amylovoran biosynthesis glycosyltransferase
MSRVALFSTNFLEYSQTFVHEEVTHHVRYEVEVFARRRLNADRFPFAPVHVGGPLYGLTRFDAGFHRAFRSGRFSLVHGHFGTGSLYAVPYAVRYQLPLLVTFHGYDVPLLRSAARVYPENWPYAMLARSLLLRMSMGLCASGELLELLVEAGAPRERLRVYHLGIDLARFKRTVRRALPRVVMVGRFVEKKGFEYGIRAHAHALARGARADLCIVGGGEREAKLKALVAELGSGEYVHFLGVLPSNEVAALLGESDVLMAPSVVGADGDRESGVIAIKEASACECAVLGTYHGGIPEIIEDGKTGFLVPERDARTLGERLHAQLTDRALCERMGKAGRAKMEREYDLSRQVSGELEGFYDEAIAIHRDGAARQP